MPSLPNPPVTIGLLLASNIFMTFAWYGHLKFKESALITVILSLGESPSSNTCCRSPQTALATAITPPPN